MIIKDSTDGISNIGTSDAGPNNKIFDEVRTHIRSFQSSTLIISDQKRNYLYPRL